jgi:peptidoglycan/xylan/chitin deacetylase (PgdA/CDA1 family)
MGATSAWPIDRGRTAPLACRAFEEITAGERKRLDMRRLHKVAARRGMEGRFMNACPLVRSVGPVVTFLLVGLCAATAWACAPAPPPSADEAAQPADEAAQPTDDPRPPWEWTDEEVRARVDPVRAGRDLTPSTWPGGARVAVLLSFDVDNETIEGLRQGSIGPLSQGEYGSRVAVPRIVELLDAETVPATFFFPAWSLKLAPQQAAVIQASGRHEIGVHGWIHESNSALDEATERRLLQQAVDAIEEIAGVRPVGYRAPSWNFSPSTLAIVRDMGFLYDSSLMADDRPYELLAGGEPTGLVELPVEWILDDAPLFDPLGNRYSPPRDVMQVWIDEFDGAWEERTMLLLTMHPHIVGHRSRIVALKGLIDHIQAKGGAWFATHEQAARWVRDQAGMGG